MDETPARVLLVEDDEDDYLLTRDLLAEALGASHQLEWLRDYGSALEVMRQGRHDVYLLDYRLGSRTGLDLLREARAAGCAGPAILLTGQGEREVDLEAMRAGAADFLVKGQLDAPALERALRYARERHRDREALRRLHDELEGRVGERTADLHRTNEALRAREEALKEAGRRKDEWIALLAHELRNPLGPLRNGLQVLKLSAADPEAVAKAWATMERQLGHLSRIVEDLLDVSRIDSGKVALRPERLDLARLARVVAGDHGPAFEQAGLALHVEAPEVPVWVTGDPTRLTQVLGNLLHNAAKFTARGGRAGVRLQADGALRRGVLRVWDTGAGLAPEMLPRLFEPFAQADRSLDRSQGGLGLGLALVKGLVELHGGQVGAASAGPGRGAEFTVTLPLEPEPAALSEVPAAPARAPRRLRILVVEDHRDAAEMLRMLLELLGHEVAVAYSGPEGVEVAGRWRPDIVLCDIGLPGMDGYGVVRALRRDPATASARVIAVTGYGSEEDRRRSQEAGFEQHLTKPVDPAALEKLLALAG